MSTPIERIRALVAAGEKATPQHWQWEPERNSMVAVSQMHSDVLGPLERWDADLFSNPWKEADMVFAAAAANARPDLALLVKLVDAVKAKYEEEKADWIRAVTKEYDADYARKHFSGHEIGFGDIDTILTQLEAQ